MKRFMIYAAITACALPFCSFGAPAVTPRQMTNYVENVFAGAVKYNEMTNYVEKFKFDGVKHPEMTNYVEGVFAGAVKHPELTNYVDTAIAIYDQTHGSINLNVFGYNEETGNAEIKTLDTSPSGERKIATHVFSFTNKIELGSMAGAEVVSSNDPYFPRGKTLATFCNYTDEQIVQYPIAGDNPWEVIDGYIEILYGTNDVENIVWAYKVTNEVCQCDGEDKLHSYKRVGGEINPNNMTFVHNIYRNTGETNLLEKTYTFSIKPLLITPKTASEKYRPYGFGNAPTDKYWYYSNNERQINSVLELRQLDVPVVQARKFSLLDLFVLPTYAEGNETQTPHWPTRPLDIAYADENTEDSFNYAEEGITAEEYYAEPARVIKPEVWYDPSFWFVWENWFGMLRTKIMITITDEWGQSYTTEGYFFNTNIDMFWSAPAWQRPVFKKRHKQNELCDIGEHIFVNCECEFCGEKRAHDYHIEVEGTCARCQNKNTKWEWGEGSYDGVKVPIGDSDTFCQYGRTKAFPCDDEAYELHGGWIAITDDENYSCVCDCGLYKEGHAHEYDESTETPWSQYDKYGEIDTAQHWSHSVCTLCNDREKYVGEPHELEEAGEQPEGYPRPVYVNGVSYMHAVYGVCSANCGYEGEIMQEHTFDYYHSGKECYCTLCQDYFHLIDNVGVKCGDFVYYVCSRCNKTFTRSEGEYYEIDPSEIENYHQFAKTLPENDSEYNTKHSCICGLVRQYHEFNEEHTACMVNGCNWHYKGDAHKCKYAKRRNGDKSSDYYHTGVSASFTDISSRCGSSSCGGSFFDDNPSALDSSVRNSMASFTLFYSPSLLDGWGEPSETSGTAATIDLMLSQLAAVEEARLNNSITDSRLTLWARWQPKSIMTQIGFLPKQTEIITFRQGCEYSGQIKVNQSGQRYVSWDEPTFFNR